MIFTTIVLNILLFVVILGVIVFIHEFGHFTWAKLTGVYVYEFAIGMGPKLFSKKGKETEYTIRAIPIGGFCSLAGEDVGDDELKKIPKNKRLQGKSCFQRFLIMFFGAGNNFILAILILFFIALVWGGTTMDAKLSNVTKGSPAYEVGLRKNDVIKEINDKKVTTSDDFALYLVVADPKKATEFVISRNGEEITYKVKPRIKKDGKKTTYVYGIEMKQKTTKGFVEAIKYTGKKTVSLFKQMAVTVAYLFTGRIKISQLSGPVGIYSVVGQQSKEGLASILYLVAFLSINVGFINLLPLPAFDGGHILFIIIEAIKGSPVDPELENKIHTVGLILLMLLMLVVTFFDIKRLF